MTAPRQPSAAAGRPRTPPRWWFKLLAPAVALGVVLAVAEGAFRVGEAILLRPTGEIWAMYDPDLGYRLNPRFGDSSPEGLRDRPLTPKNGRVRLLMLGDSLGYYGDTIDDTWVGRFRRELAKPPARAPFDVLNAGIKGYTNYQELGFLKKYGLAFEPDVVGVGFVLNDLHKILHSFKVENGRIVGETYDFTPEAVQSVESPLFRLARQSHLLVWLRRTFDSAITGLQHDVQRGFTFDYRPDVNTAWKDDAWKTVDAQMREMTALGRKHGFRVFMLIFPFADQYLPEYLARDRAYVLKPQRRAIEMCARLSIPCLDLYPLLEPRLFLDDHLHLTREGRQRVAEIAADFVRRERILPPADPGAPAADSTANDQ